VGTPAVGLDYFGKGGIAIVVDVRDTVNFSTDMMLNGPPSKLHLDLIWVLGGLRIFFP